MFVTLVGLARVIGAAEMISGRPLMDKLTSMMPEMGITLTDLQCRNLKRDCATYTQTVIEIRRKTDSEYTLQAEEGDTD